MSYDFDNVTNGAVLDCVFSTVYAETGISVVGSSSNVTIRGNTIQSYRDVGIGVSGSQSVSVVNNTIAHCRFGILLFDATGCDVSNNSVLGNWGRVADVWGL